MKQRLPKTNAVRLLEKWGVPYSLVAYEVDESDLSATHVAATLGEDVKQVYKTIVLHGDRNGHFVCVVPADAEIDLKKAAKVSGNKKVELLAMKELLPTTGYIRGGCSPIGMKKAFPTYLQQEALSEPYIYISAGQRGLQVKLTAADLISCTKATTDDFIVSQPEEDI